MSVSLVVQRPHHRAAAWLALVDWRPECVEQDCLPARDEQSLPGVWESPRMKVDVDEVDHAENPRSYQVQQHVVLLPLDIQLHDQPARASIGTEPFLQPAVHVADHARKVHDTNVRCRRVLAMHAAVYDPGALVLLVCAAFFEQRLAVCRAGGGAEHEDARTCRSQPGRQLAKVAPMPPVRLDTDGANLATVSSPEVVIEVRKDPGTSKLFRFINFADLHADVRADVQVNVLATVPE
mmetsp:Transcript_83477/g.232892  ORF Transcript_83477/g.232892 Transcript_83477/m.232892 type:complete len:237 (-) Transcript_83477:280-990(-)